MNRYYCANFYSRMKCQKVALSFGSLCSLCAYLNVGIPVSEHLLLSCDFSDKPDDIQIRSHERHEKGERGRRSDGHPGSHARRLTQSAGPTAFRTDGVYELHPAFK